MWRADLAFESAMAAELDRYHATWLEWWHRLGWDAVAGREAQLYGCDLLGRRPGGRCIGIEEKAVRSIYSKLYFETHHADGRESWALRGPMASALVYAMVDDDRLVVHRFDSWPSVRYWFRERVEDFPERRIYGTRGRLVPLVVLRREVELVTTVLTRDSNLLLPREKSTVAA